MSVVKSGVEDGVFHAFFVLVPPILTFKVTEDVHVFSGSDGAPARVTINLGISDEEVRAALIEDGSLTNEDIDDVIAAYHTV